MDLKVFMLSAAAGCIRDLQTPLRPPPLPSLFHVLRDWPLLLPQPMDALLANSIPTSFSILRSYIPNFKLTSSKLHPSRRFQVASYMSAETRQDVYPTPPKTLWPFLLLSWSLSRSSDNKSGVFMTTIEVLLEKGVTAAHRRAHLSKLGVPWCRPPHSSSTLARAIHSPALYTHSPLQRLTHTAGYAYLLCHIRCRRKRLRQRQRRGADVRRDSSILAAPLVTLKDNPTTPKLELDTPAFAMARCFTVHGPPSVNDPMQSFSRHSLSGFPYGKCRTLYFGTLELNAPQSLEPAPAAPADAPAFRFKIMLARFQYRVRVDNVQMPERGRSAVSFGRRECCNLWKGASSDFLTIVVA
ncbi:hypothetical protein C8R44DRAFT_852402 [Mycena epipterygia]|nr:hypothetical protein C8R44DRAFT_852402 [Mycena epipterygia]